MELALSLGDTPKPFPFLEKSPTMILGKDLGFCMAAAAAGDVGDDNNGAGIAATSSKDADARGKASSSTPPLQLELLPFSPVHKTNQQSSCPSLNKIPFPWLHHNSDSGLGFELNRRSDNNDGGDDQAAATAMNSSSPNSAVSPPPPFLVDFSMFRSGKRDSEQMEGSEADRGTSSRGSDDEENGNSRKKLRLSKDQSAFLEESFKEHNTLNPKQKLALAKQLNLRPRQVEVWFQNRRARTKLKQTEVDCEYLKRCCETLTEENRRLQKELQELRALKASQPFYMQLPATTLTMCPSCERVATTATAAGNINNKSSNPKPLSLSANNNNKNE
ncbi:homeobox-leucine zipper protein HOX11 isoform X2 [Andrographis paniculata]|uniref:homeobox-leucine zipper protein HOX11 isoform X2 n=1 Tax=Andrographis paniculata TaxID=175694 RepID=UPI0021E91C27|nr:homeobox-leucine zipper protein HOX11 isoform X2 [Andrographis paniculata]